MKVTEQEVSEDADEHLKTILNTCDAKPFRGACVTEKFNYWYS